MLELILTRPFERKLIEAARGLRFLVFDELQPTGVARAPTLPCSRAGCGRLVRLVNSSASGRRRPLLALAPS
jgi:hypothetical protein